MYIGQDLQVAFPSYLNIDDISGSFNSVTTSFALTVNGSTPVPLPINSQQCLISVGGIIQRPDDTGTEGFRLSGSNIVFSSAPNTGEDFFGTILAGADYINAGVNFPDGQSGAPSITFDQDLDTGFFRSSSGAVSFSSNGVNTATLGSNSFTAPSFIPTSSSVPSNGIFLPAANNVAIATNGTQRATVDSSGRLLVGTSTNFASTLFQVNGSVAAGRATADAFSNHISLTKTRSTSPNGFSIVSSGDEIGGLRYLAADGSAYVQAASIYAYVDGTPGAGDMPGRLVFSTTADGASSPTERMRITSGGDVLIGQQTNPATSRVTIQVQTGTANGVNAQITSNTGTSFPWANYNASGTYVGGISCTSTATSFPTSSDYRLKTNVQPLTGAISLVSQLKPSTFEFNENPGETVQGFIAHELQEVVPLAVIGEKDAEDANGNPVYQGVDAAKLVPLLTAALQEAVAKIESLEARLTAAGI